ncbi:MAG TPA: SulP family inorganic anion transporter [Acidimicrobiia bacterium]|nr:SulP family inorganic anion transporter [Acidimicrobiia bacterium]
MKLRLPFQRSTLREDGVAGLVLGVQSVPDGLAGGLLAGVNPLYGLYAYMIGTITGALFTSSAFMAVQATGAMAIVVADVPAVHGGDDPARALFTLSILTGLVMLGAGLLKLGFVLRFVSNAVMVGFINAVGINIVLGQLDSFTGYESDGSNRVLRAIDTVLNPGQWDWPTVLIGVATIGLIIGLERTKLGPLGMVVAIVTTSGAVALFSVDGVAQLRDIAEVPRSLPLPMLPDLGLALELLVPAAALAFVGLVQGAGISANFPNPDGTYPEASQDFVGQGAANVAAGFFQGMPVGGSMSATSLVHAAGAKSRQANLIAGAVIAGVILALGGAVGYIAMPAIAGLLMLVGYRTVKPHELLAVWKTGRTQAVVLGVTFTLTMLIPLQNAVLAGVGISVILYVISQSNAVTVLQRIYSDDGDVIETDPPRELSPHQVVVLQPYGSLFFAAAQVFEEALPEVTAISTGSVVILRLRGRTDMGSTFMDVLERYARSLQAVGGKLVIVSGDDRLNAQLETTGVMAVVGSDNIYTSDERVGATVRRAHDDALGWVATEGRGEGNEPT